MYRARIYAVCPASSAVTATDGTTTFASATRSLGTTFANYEVTVDPPLVASFSPTAFNTIELTPSYPGPRGCTPGGGIRLNGFLIELID